VFARLRGIVIETDESGACVVDVAGVGYEVHVPFRIVSRLPAAPQEVTLHIHTHVREDAFSLYGFSTPDDRFAFRTLMTVSGVGPKLALAILSDVAAAELSVAIARGDKKRLQAISGVGKKVAERLVLELRDKLPAPTAASLRADVNVATPMRSVTGDPLQAAAEALVQMGFSRGEAERAVVGLDASESVESVLRKALAALA
jgi:Holliday junction DNA helicase RuvA